MLIRWTPGIQVGSLPKQGPGTRCRMAPPCLAPARICPCPFTPRGPTPLAALTIRAGPRSGEPATGRDGFVCRRGGVRRSQRTRPLRPTRAAGAAVPPNVAGIISDGRPQLGPGADPHAAFPILVWAPYLVSSHYARHLRPSPMPAPSFGLTAKRKRRSRASTNFRAGGGPTPVRDRLWWPAADHVEIDESWVRRQGRRRRGPRVHDQRASV